MKRRNVLLAGALGALAPSFALAQARPVRVGMLTALAKSLFAPIVLQRLTERGYREGSSMQLEHRHPAGVVDRFPKLAQELIDLKCDVIFAIGPEHAARALRDARSDVPIVFLALDYDPLEKRIVHSLRRPGANITGVYVPQVALAAKRLEIARALIPAARRFLVLSDAYSKDQLDSLRKAADAVRVDLTVVEFTTPPYDLWGAFETGRQAGAEVLIGLSSPLLLTVSLSAPVAKYRLPAVSSSSADAGFIAGYGPDFRKAAVRAADIGIMILKGVKPGDIAVEQINEDELVLNLKTAKALDVKIPPSVLARATRIIQ